MTFVHVVARHSHLRRRGGTSGIGEWPTVGAKRQLSDHRSFAHQWIPTKSCVRFRPWCRTWRNLRRLAGCRFLNLICRHNSQTRHNPLNPNAWIWTKTNTLNWLLPLTQLTNEKNQQPTHKHQNYPHHHHHGSVRAPHNLPRPQPPTPRSPR